MKSFLLLHHFNAIVVTVEQHASYRDRWPPGLLQFCRYINH